MLAGIWPSAPPARTLPHQPGPEGTELNWFQEALSPKRKRTHLRGVFFSPHLSLHTKLELLDTIPANGKINYYAYGCSACICLCTPVESEEDIRSLEPELQTAVSCESNSEPLEEKTALRSTGPPPPLEKQSEWGWCWYRLSWNVLFPVLKVLTVYRGVMSCFQKHRFKSKKVRRNVLSCQRHWKIEEKHHWASPLGTELVS